MAKGLKNREPATVNLEQYCLQEGKKKRNRKKKCDPREITSGLVPGNTVY